MHTCFLTILLESKYFNHISTHKLNGCNTLPSCSDCHYMVCCSEGPWDEAVCGRPLGMRFASDGKLLVADSYLGIFIVDVDTGLCAPAFLGVFTSSQAIIIFDCEDNLTEKHNLYSFNSKRTNISNNLIL